MHQLFWFNSCVCNPYSWELQQKISAQNWKTRSSGITRILGKKVENLCNWGKKGWKYSWTWEKKSRYYSQGSWVFSLNLLGFFVFFSHCVPTERLRAWSTKDSVLMAYSSPVNKQLLHRHKTVPNHLPSLYKWIKTQCDLCFTANLYYFFA